jgi:putative ABC transport system permease protein
MTSLAFAGRSLIRQPARAILGVVGVAVVGALLFDMLLLSRGLVVSFEELLEGTGFDLRVSATNSIPGMGPKLVGAAAHAAAIRALPEIDEVVSVRFGRAEMAGDNGRRGSVEFTATSSSEGETWKLRAGRGLDAGTRGTMPPVLVNRQLQEMYEVRPGSTLELRGECGSDYTILPPTRFEVTGIVDLQFDIAGIPYAVVRLDDFRTICPARSADVADFLLVASSDDTTTTQAAAAILEARPELNAISNRQLVGRFESTDFSYFRQISFALATITLCFAFLLIATLLTVSVNQRLAEVATLRALGFPRRRVAADLLWESALLVGSGGLLAVPLGGLLAMRLDSILRAIPGLPERLHFFVFEPRAVWLYGGLLLVTGVAAAIYPVYLAARLPIAETLRKEIVS